MIRVQHQLKESELRLLHVLEVTREGIWDWHLPSGAVQHNRQWYAALGYAEGEIEPSIEALIHPDDLPQVNQPLRICSKARWTCNSEHRMLRKDGHAIWVQDRGRVVQRDAQGKPERVVGSYTDISYQGAAAVSAAYCPLAPSPACPTGCCWRTACTKPWR